MQFLSMLAKKRQKLADRLAVKSVRLPLNLGTGLIIAGLGLVLLAVLDSQVIESDRDAVGSAAFPRLTLTVMLLAAAYLIFKDILRLMQGKALEYKDLSLLTEVKALCIFAIFLITYAIASLFSFLAAAIVCAIAFLVFFKVTKLSWYITACTLAALIWAAFRYGLMVRF